MNEPQLPGVQGGNLGIRGARPGWGPAALPASAGLTRAGALSHRRGFCAGHLSIVLL